MHAADTAPGPQRARTAALTAVLLLTSARLSEVTGADVADLGTKDGRRVLWVTRAHGRRRGLPLPGPAASRIDAYLAAQASQADGQADGQALFATRTGRRLFAADVRRALRRLAARAGLPADQARQLGPRMIQHSLATWYLRPGGPPPGPYSTMRHPSPQTTQQPGQSPACLTRDLGSGPWPRGRPHCRARRPQHAAGNTRPRLTPPGNKRAGGRADQQVADGDGDGAGCLVRAKASGPDLVTAGMQQGEGGGGQPSGGQVGAE
jgi:hypothetical protein